MRSSVVTETKEREGGRPPGNIRLKIIFFLQMRGFYGIMKKIFSLG